MVSCRYCAPWRLAARATKSSCTHAKQLNAPLQGCTRIHAKCAAQEVNIFLTKLIIKDNY
jgi:hypothetical protein